MHKPISSFRDTPKICNQLFNLLKLEWRKWHVYTPKQLELLLEDALNCECVQCGEGFFKDWAKQQDEFWHALSGETCMSRGSMLF